jgi:hypothetical protein
LLLSFFLSPCRDEGEHASLVLSALARRVPPRALDPEPILEGDIPGVAIPTIDHGERKYVGRVKKGVGV